jgi:hypothetical protein
MSQKDVTRKPWIMGDTEETKSGTALEAGCRDQGLIGRLVLPAGAFRCAVPKV